MTAAHTTQATGGGTRVGFLVLGSIEFLTVMDASVVNIGLPVIKDDLGFSPSGTAWIVNCFLIPFAGVLLLAGRLGDVWGRRRLFVAGTALFTAASASCALASEPWHLLTGRTLQGLGAGLVTPTALALITDLLPDGPARYRALAVFAGMGGVAAPIGLTLGGVLAEVHWPLIFWINAPLGVLVIAAAMVALPAPRRTATTLDVPGAIAATGALALLTYAAASVGEAPGIATAVAGLGAVLFGLALVARQFRAADPLIPRALMHIRSVPVGAAAFTVVGTILLATFYIVTLYLQDIRGLGSLEATAVYLPLPLAMLAGTQAAPRLMDRWSPRDVLAIGLAVQGVSLGAWAVTSSDEGSLMIGLVIPATPWAAGLGLAIVSGFAVCTADVPASMTGAASGIATTAYQGGGAVGLAAMAAVAAATTQHTGVADSPSALLAGHRAAMWSLTALAALGVFLTRALPHPPATNHDRR